VRAGAAAVSVISAVAGAADMEAAARALARALDSARGPALDVERAPA
jgi:thiamine monophosphate synthase